MAGMTAGAAALWVAGLPLSSDPDPPALAPGLDAGDGAGDLGKELHNWSSLIGIVIAIVGNALIALALNVQRYAHIRLHRERVRIKERARAALKAAQAHNGGGGGGGERSPSGSYGTISPDNRADASDGYDSDAHSDRTPLLHHEESAGSDYSADDLMHDDQKNSSYLKSPYWWMGQVLITVGEMGNFLAYGFAPASIVSPLGVVALIANCIIAPIFFGEVFRPQDLWGVAVAVGGVVTVVLSAKGEETRLDPHDVWEAITQTAFEIYMVITVVLIAVLVWMSRKYGRKTILIDLGLVGLFGGYTALSTKAISSILSASFLGAFTTPLTYVLLMVLLGTAILQVRYVNRSLQRFDSTQVIPVQFVMFTMCVIIGSAVLYRDFERTSLDQFSKFVGGCLMTFFGVFIITNGRASHNDEDDEETLSDAEGIAETIGLSRQEASAPPQMDGSPSGPPSRRSSRASKPASRNGRKKSITAFPHDASLSSLSLHLQMTSEHPKAPISESAPMLSTYLGQTDPLGVSRGLPLYSDTLVSPPEHAPGAVPPTTVVTPAPAPPYHHNTFPFQADHHANPRHSSPSTPRRQSLQRQHTFISPSPLSTTVTTVVNDALGQPDSPNHLTTHTSSLRRIRSSIRASLFLDGEYSPELEDGPADQDGWGLLPGVAPANGPEGDERTLQNRSRSRSLSDAIGELLRVPKRRKPAKDQPGYDSGTEDEEGPIPGTPQPRPYYHHQNPPQP